MEEKLTQKEKQLQTVNQEPDKDATNGDFALKMRSDKLDMLEKKLEKLDKLDELLRKLDSLKFVGGGSMAGGDANNAYDSLKAELDELQKIIIDESGKYSEKEKEDANIRFEKAYQSLQQTVEYKMELQKQIEEKRKLNEPLNKEARDRLLHIYTPENIQNDPELKEKVHKNPELTLICLDAKVILSKHQNDFQQYLLRNLDLDELRAIRASLPKFRNDQKRQLDWVDSLEDKIEQLAKNPIQKPPPPKPAAKKVIFEMLLNIYCHF